MGGRRRQQEEGGATAGWINRRMDAGMLQPPDVSLSLCLSVCPSVGQPVSLNRGENGGAAVARQPGMLGGGDDISISIIGSHEAERCSTEAPQEEEVGGDDKCG